MPKTEQKIIIKASDRTKQAFRSVKAGLVSMTSATAKMATAFGILGAAFAIKEAVAFEKAMTEVTTLLDDTSQIQAMTDAVRELSREFGIAPTDQAAALYQVISAGAADAASAMGLLEVANKLAIAGVTDVNTAVDGLTTAMNVFSKQGLTATEAADAMFVAMRAGKTTVGEMSSALGLVIPLAKDAGLSFDESAAAVAALTKAGIKTKVAVAGLRAILAVVAKPSKEAATLAKELGINFGIAGLQAKGFAGFMKEVAEKTGGSTEKLALLFGGVEAIIPALNFAGSAGVFFNEIMADMGKKTGQMEKGFEKMSETADFQFKRFKASASVLAESFGVALLPAITDFLSTVNDEFPNTADLGKLSLAKFKLGVIALEEAFVNLNRIAVNVLDFLPGTTLLFNKEDVKFINDFADALDEAAMATAMEIISLEASIAARETAKNALLAEGKAGQEVKGTIDDVTDSTNALTDSTKELSEKTVNSIKSIITSLEKQQATLGLTATQIKAYELSLLGADDATIQLAVDLANSIDQYNKQIDVVKEVEAVNKSARKEQAAFNKELDNLAQTVLAQLKTPLDDYNEALALHDQLLQAGRLSAIEWGKANEAASKQLEDSTKAAKETIDIAKELGLTFESAFENAVIQGEGLRSVLQGIFEDIQRIILRKTITEKVGGFFADLIGNIDFGFGGGSPALTGGTGGMGFGLAKGTDFIPRDGFQFLHRGEAVIPAAQNNALFGGVVQNITIDARGSEISEARLRAAAQEGAELGYQMVINDLQRNGPARDSF